MKHVIVAGHLCVDITPAIPAGKDATVEKIFCPGRLTNVGSVDIHTGGTVANTGLAMKFLGVDVSLIGKIGQDHFGGIVHDFFRVCKAEEHLVASEQVSTSYTIALAVPETDRIFLHHPGANDFFTKDDISEELLHHADLFHFGYPPLMKSMYVNQGTGLYDLLAKAKEAGCAVSMDMAAVDEKSDAGQADWQAILQKSLPLTDIFLPSAEELLFMLNRSRWHELSEKAHGTDLAVILDRKKDLEFLAGKCLEMGAKIVVIKCGAAGIFLKTCSKEKLSPLHTVLGLDPENWADQSLFEPAFIPEYLLSSTGAGDAAIAAFLTALLQGCKPEECLQMAVAEGAASVTAYDALSGLKSLEELREKIRRGWEKTRYMT